MSHIRESMNNWFGFTRQERRSTFILLLIIIVIIGVRFVVPGNNITVEDIPIVLMDTATDGPLYSGSFILPSEQKKTENISRQKPLLDINTCDSASLVSLPGIGPVLSGRIIKYRKLIGGYAKTNQLLEVYGLTEETYSLISGRIIADSGAVRKIKINEAGYRDFIRHPYFQKKDVSGILKYRELQGRITEIQDLVKNNIISDETGRRIRPYINFGD